MFVIKVSHTHTHTQEKRRTRKALEMKKGVEWKYESLHKHNTKITTDLATARTQLKLSRRRIQELEVTQSQVGRPLDWVSGNELVTGSIIVFLS